MRHFNQMLTLQGSVQSVEPDQKRCELLLQSGDTVTVHMGPETSFSVLTNVDGVDRDKVPEPEASPEDQKDALKLKVMKYLRQGDTVFVRAIYMENDGERRMDARGVWLLHYKPKAFIFEETHWWLTQTARLADAWLDELFGDARDYQTKDFVSLYRTNLNIIGGQTDDTLQAMATLSRFIYGLSSAYLLTGDQRYEAAAKAGIEFQRTSFRTLSHDGQYCFWAYGRRKKGNQSVTILASENDDDKGAIPLYEQIYALAGLTQYYRITNDAAVLEDIIRTVRAFDSFFLDLKSVNPDFPGHDGYFSHLDPATMRPDTDALGPRKLRKNWNSIGDHIPAYLVNIILALEPLPQNAHPTLISFLDSCKTMLERVTRLILDKFPAREKSPYVNERFLADWRPDHEWGWQKNRAVVGHNYKIAWNLTRVAHYLRAQGNQELAERATTFAEKLARDMVNHGADLIRGGCFDAVERNPSNGQPIEFVWGNTKDFWQQEQAILANLILYGHNQDAKLLEQARSMAGFWNMFFLDRDNQGVFFRVTDNGVPVVESGYANKAGYAIAGYHTFELNFLAHIYMRAYVAPASGSDANFCLYFHPSANNGLRSINVLPDFVKPGHLKLASVTINGRPWEGFDPDTFQVQLPEQEPELGFKIIAQFTRSHS